MNEEELTTRQEKREQKLKKKREQMLKHGKGLGQVYGSAALKRAKKDKPKD